MARIAVIMAGGTGERFWPVSRRDRPKQLLKLCGTDKSLLEEAVARVEPLFGKDGIFIATGESLAKAIESAKLVHPSNILVEPAKRNTLGALMWACAHLMTRGHEKSTVAVLTADHAIGESENFQNDVKIALEAAEKSGALVTIGVKPTRAETGYGYIEAGNPDASAPKAFKVRRFVEKPRRDLAEEFVKSGHHYWNSGMFFWSLSGFLDEVRLAQPQVHRILMTIARDIDRGDEASAKQRFEMIPDLSVDVAVMEIAQNVLIVPASFPWDDLGAWDALERTLSEKQTANACVGEVESVDSSGCIVYNDSPGTLAALVGVEDVVVVITPDAVLVCKKDRAQKVKEIVERLKSRNDPRV